MIELQEVSKIYGLRDGRLAAVDSVTLTVQKGSIHGIIGPSGAGKSTLLRIMNRLERPDAGKVFVDGNELTQLSEAELRVIQRSMGMIFQQFHLLHNRTVLGNVCVPLELAGIKRKERVQRARECLEFVGLSEKADQYPAALSGGQKQRVAIARALASNPRVLLCDEPTSALDPRTTGDILKVLRHANETFGVTIVLVTHEMDVVAELCTEVSVMEDGRLTDTFSLGPRSRKPVSVPKLSYREQLLGKIEGRERL